MSIDQANELRNMIKEHTSSKKNARVITVTSGKGGVGKTNVAVNLAIELNKLGQKVIVFDADFGLANVEVLFGIIPQNNLADLMYRNKNIQDILTDGPQGIKFISGGSGIQELTNLSKEQVQYLIQQLNEIDELADIIIIDTGAGISNNVLEFVIASSEILLITTPEPTSITDSYALLKALNRHAAFLKEETKINVITNRVKSEKEGTEIFSKLSLVADRFLNLKIGNIGPIMQDDNLRQAVMEQKPVTVLFENTVSSKNIQDIAKKMLSIEVEPTKRGLSKMISNILKNKLFK